MTLVPLDEIREVFTDLDDREDQAEYLVELGEGLPPFPESARSEENRVLGCQSKVWVTAAEQGSPPVLQFRGDSDAPIVRGLVHMLLSAYNEKSPQEIVEFPIEFRDRQAGESKLSHGIVNEAVGLVARLWLADRRGRRLRRRRSG